MEKYLIGKLTASETEEFEQAVAKDEELKSALETALLRNYAVFKSARDLEVAQLRKQLPPEPLAQVRPFYQRYGLAIAAALALLVLAYFAFKPSPKLSTQEIYAAHYEPMRGPEAKKEGAQNLLKNADQAYNQKDFAQAIPLYAEYLSQADAPEQERARLLLGISYMEQQQFPDAVAQLSLLPEGNESGAWYLALSHLQTSEIAKAKALFQKMADRESHFYQKKAAEVLKNLEE